MTFWDIIPINKDADMSLWSTFMFFIGASASGVYTKYINMRENNMEKRLDNHDEAITDIRERLAGIEATSQSTLAIVEKLDKKLSDEGRIYQQALINSIKSK